MALLLLLIGHASAWAQSVSELIIYDGRVWFTNSQPYVDNNAADIYSYDPTTAALRFERGLFSQDVGIPAVVDGRLFLPFEDPRFNMSFGEYAVTDGEDWRWRRLSEGTAFHTHSIGRCGDVLLAVTGAWEGQLHVSEDDGQTWTLTSIYPAKEARFSRLIEIGAWQGRCFVSAMAKGRRDAKLLEWRNGDLAPVSAWPIGWKTDRLVTWNGKLLALNHADSGTRLLAFDGASATSLTLPGTGRLRDLAADGETLWAVTSNGPSGKLWRTGDGVTWKGVQQFDEAPIAVTALGGHVFVGTFASGGGSLWGPRNVDVLKKASPTTPFEQPTIRPVPPALWADFDRSVEAFLEQRVGAHAGIETVNNILRRLTAYDDPDIGERLSARLTALDIRDSVGFFSREDVKRSHRLAWYLLGAMAVTGQGHIPPHLLGLSLSTNGNDQKKNIDAPIAAIAAVGWIGQNDHQTMEPWLIADITGALSAITGQDYGHDIKRWRSWWMDQTN